MADRVLLLGAGGKTGTAYARLLQQHGHHVLWYDKNSANAPQQLDAAQLTHVAHDALDFEKLKDKFDRVTLTPGVPLSLPFIQEAKAHGKVIFTEVAYSAPYLSDFQIIGVTGTDGKSTTTTLIAQILRSLGHDAIECGNFGIPLSEIVLERERFARKILVCELSSYQLEEPGALALAAAIFLNLAPDHLNRYESVAAYGLAKWNILRLLKKNGLALIAKKLAPGATDLWQENHPLDGYGQAVAFVDTEALRSQHFSIAESKIFFSDARAIADLTHCALAGRHNYSNLLFAIEAVYAFFPSALLEKLQPALDALRPLPHRFEYIPQSVLPQLKFINDSKATTTQATLTALANAESPLFILLGGQGKGERYGILARALAEKKARALIFGECKIDMAADFRAEGYQNFTLHDNLFKAFHAAKRMALQMQPAGGVILLSPAVTSWDQFSSFEERGDYFRQLVQNL
ncbi:MAG: UDP-N-acetylmuramoyl-L-alanine--D-glutamate ligase [Spirochaetes bacterium]|nr:UDP-N-acetylmuramoyl-L-alanine--D-glutamate ligase [Spirochaetota bacterium]